MIIRFYLLQRLIFSPVFVQITNSTSLVSLEAKICDILFAVRALLRLTSANLGMFFKSVNTYVLFTKFALNRPSVAILLMILHHEFLRRKILAELAFDLSKFRICIDELSLARAILFISEGFKMNTIIIY